MRAISLVEPCRAGPIVTTGTIGSRARRVAHLLFPPIVQVSLARLRKTQPEWVYASQEWPADDEVRGWNAQTVADRAIQEWPPLQEAAAGTGPLAPDSLVVHNTVMSFAYALGRAAWRRDQVSFLDWGGGVGRYSLIANALFPEVEIDYHCRDMELVNGAGRSLQPDATFHDSDEEALGRRYDFVLASGSLHYSEDWRTVLRQLAEVADPYLFVTRQPFVSGVSSYVVIQRPSVSGYYDTEYPGWVLNRAEFLAATEASGLELEREFITGEELYVRGAPEQAAYRGFLLRKVS